MAAFFPVEVKNTQQLSAGTTTLNFQVSDVCGNTDSGTLTIVATNIVSILIHVHIVPEMIKFYFHGRVMFNVNGGVLFKFMKGGLDMLIKWKFCNLD